MSEQSIGTGAGLVVGFGNPYRKDDGAAHFLVNELRRRLCLPELEPDEDGLDELGHPVDTLTMHQLLPELAPVVARYRRVVFVDAHSGTIPEDVRVLPVQEEYGVQAVTHHMSPGMLLFLARGLTGTCPEAWLISVRGEDFGLGMGLTPTCAACVERAVGEVERLLDREASSTC
ncbi:MAG TPA: hydrogenase maturation protease [Armatimonadota bacterium]